MMSPILEGALAFGFAALGLALAMIIIMLLRPRGLWPAPEHGKSLTQKT